MFELKRIKAGIYVRTACVKQSPQAEQTQIQYLSFRLRKTNTPIIFTSSFISMRGNL